MASQAAMAIEKMSDPHKRPGPAPRRQGPGSPGAVELGVDATITRGVAQLEIVNGSKF